MPIRYILILMLYCFLIDCKETLQKAEIKDDPFYLELEEGCKKNTSSEIMSDDCIEKKEKLFCYRYLEELKTSSLNNILYNEEWFSDDMQSFIYVIDKYGKIKILRGGPDRKKDEFELSGNGKLQYRNNKWHFQQTCEENYCEKIEFDIEYISCYAGYSSGYDSYVLILTLKDSDYFGEDDEKRKRRKEITYMKLINKLPQIPNGFISTPVPPRPSP